MPAPARLALSIPAAACLAFVGATMSGCQVLGFIAAGRREAEENRLRDIDAEYKGLEGKSFAVVVAADRAIRSDHPGAIEEITARVAEQLYKGANAAGWIPPADVLAWQYSHPRWIVMPRAELAKELGVDRLVVVELAQFRLNEPGNQYLWAGLAEGQVGVVEADAPAGAADEFAFTKPVSVRYPDKAGYGPSDVSGAEIASVLLKRFVDRSSWPFYTHQEKGKMDY